VRESDEVGVPGARSVHRVALVLRALAAGDGEADGRRIAWIARRTGLTEPTTARLLRALAVEGFAERHADGRWALGGEIDALARLRSRVPGGFWDAADGAVRALVEDTGAVVTLWFETGGTWTCVRHVEGVLAGRIGPAAALGIAGGAAVEAAMACILAEPGSRVPADAEPFDGDLTAGRAVRAGGVVLVELAGAGVVDAGGREVARLLAARPRVDASDDALTAFAGRVRAAVRGLGQSRSPYSASLR
jgi:DNA-binding IclR family transcriptional regulator